MKAKLMTLALALGVITFTLMTAQRAAADTPDAWITMKAKIALLTADGVDSSDLNVDTVNGVVTLHGKVHSEQAKAKAESIATSIDGVKQVKNVLQVVPETARDTVDAQDDAIKASVEKAIDANPMYAGIDVASVNKGVVLLSGKAKTLEAHLKAIETAYRVKGVRRVSTEVTVET